MAALAQRRRTMPEPILSFSLVVYANKTCASVMFTVPTVARERLDIHEDQIALVGHEPVHDFERFPGPPGPGIWIFEGQPSSPVSFAGTWRQPTSDEVRRIAAGTWPGVQVPA